MSIKRIPNWQYPSISNVDNKEVVDWLKIHHIEHEEESVSRLQDFENITIDNITAGTIKLTGLTDGYIPYHVSDAAGLADSGLYWDGTQLGIGTVPAYSLHIKSDAPWIQLEDTSPAQKKRIGVTENSLYFYDETDARTDMVIDTLGIFTMPAYGTGTATFSAAGVISSVSDERLKKNIRKFKTSLSALDDIDPIYYKWNKESGMEDGYEYVGFSAQNVEKTIPEAIGHNSDGMKSFSDRAIIAVLVNSVKELKAEIEELRSEIH